MKTKHLVLALLLPLFCANYLFARNILWKPEDKPPVPLVEAHNVALAALKARHKDFYCTSAHLAKTFSEGDWEFQFSSKDGTSSSVSVSSDKQVRVSDQGFHHY